MRSLLYICTGLPKEEVKKIQDKQNDFSSNALVPPSVFHTNIIEGISENYDKVDVIACAPISRQHYDILYYKESQYRIDNVTYHLPGFLNIRIFKQLTVMLKVFILIMKWKDTHKNDLSNIVIDGSFFTGLLPLYFSELIKKFNCCAIIVDLYEYMDPTLKGNKKDIVKKMYRKLLKIIDSYVFVTDYLEKLLNFYNKKYVLMEGLVDKSLIFQNNEKNIGNFCLYAGGLHEIYGIKNLVDAFEELDTEMELHLYGNGELIEYIKNLEKKDSRIKYKGIVSHEKLVEIERHSRFLINPRPVSGILDTRYNFPSKLMEYMQSGRPVITTKLYGIPNCYDDKMIFFENDDKLGIKLGLLKMMNYSDDELIFIGDRAKNFVNNCKTNEIFGKKIFHLMNNDDNL